MKRTKHSLSHYKLLTANMGKLVPVGCYPVLPGDTVQQRTSALIRVSPLVAPVMHPVVVRFHHWFVPYRILWPQWEDFITGGPDGLNADTPPTHATVDDKGTIDDYTGLPLVAGINVNSWYRLAYNSIFNQNYRDQDLVSEKVTTTNDLANIAWEKDYFTAARPWTQKGDEVTLPVGGTAPVTIIPTGDSEPAFTLPGAGTYNLGSVAGQNDTVWSGVPPGTTTNAEWADPKLAGIADLGSADQISINDFRMGFALQRYKEARARYGSRYTEYLAYLGVKSSDARLQRPEYLGGGKQTISFSEVLNTTSAIDDPESGLDDLGRMGGHGITAMRTNRFRKFFEEHGCVMTLMSVRPKAIYNDGIHREFLKTTKEDYYQRELEHVGQQEILNNEVYADAAAGDQTFGFGDRYAEYRSHPSTVAADFRDTLDYWHMARKFAAPPALNQSFTDCDATKRIHADQTGGDVLWCMVNHSIQARRLVKKVQPHRVL
jgi:hypothetical protein